MFTTLLFLHSLFRWLLLAGLLTSIIRAYRGWLGGKPFTKLDNTLRHSTATLSHLQLSIGFVLYFSSPLVRHFLANARESLSSIHLTFFGLIHISLMFSAVVLITLGSAFTKRKENDQAKFKTVAIWLSIALLLILVAIPWPFSPLAARPYFREF